MTAHYILLSYFFAIIHRPKHPLKVHVWAGISLKGPTKICIFDGIMDAKVYTTILETHLLPFISQKFPNGHRFMQDNDPKHTSNHVQQFFQDNGVNWWKTIAESPDCNPIENLWHELKEFIRREAKPHTKDELVEAIKQFWKSVDRHKCTRYATANFSLLLYANFYFFCFLNLSNNFLLLNLFCSPCTV